MAAHETYFATSRQLRNFKIRQVLHHILVYGFLTIIGIFILIPFIYMLVTSFRDPQAFEFDKADAVFSLFPSWWNEVHDIPNYSISNYQVVFGLEEMAGTKVNFLLYYGNTIFVAAVQTIFTLATSVLAAFAFARCEFKGKNALFMLLLATMMIPGEMMVITNFQTVQMLGWQNTYSALIFVHGVSVFYIFYLRQTFQQIPNELFLAAKVDGYGHFRYLWRVMIPIASPTILTIAILSLMGAWNAYVWPNLVANGDYRYSGMFGVNEGWEMYLVSNGLMRLFTNTDTGANYDTVKIAGSVIVTAPLFVFFLIFRKYIMRGVSRSGIKG